MVRTALRNMTQTQRIAFRARLLCRARLADKGLAHPRADAVLGRFLVLTGMN